MSEEIDALKDAIRLSRENMLTHLLAHLSIEEINEDDFQFLLSLIEHEEQLRFKYSKALESQEVIESVLKDRLR